MRNIAILSYSLTAGGAERIVGLLSKYLSKSYNVYLFLQDCSVISYDYGGTIVDLSANGVANIEQTVMEYKDKYVIDCAISFLIVMNCINVRTRRNESVILSNRCSFGEMTPFPDGESKRISTWYNDADGIVSCSYGAMYDLVHNFGIDACNITSIYNFIDKDKIKKNSVEDISENVIDFIGDSKVVLNVGRLDDQKNQRKLIVQFSKLVSDGYNVRLIILGSGYMEKRLKELTRDLGIYDKVLFETYCNNPFPYYRISNVMAVSADYEGLPNVILEAMALGLPVVSVDCLSGPLELIKGEYDYSHRIKGIEVCERGVLVEHTDTDTRGETWYLADGIKSLLNDDGLCDSISKKASMYMEKYDNNHILEAWINVVEKTVPKKGIQVKRPLKELDVVSKVIVYGAGIYGRMIMRYILGMKRNFELLCFAVASKSDNPDFVYGVPVFQIEELLKYRNDSLVLIGVSAKFEKDTKDILDRYGFEYAYSDI